MNKKEIDRLIPLAYQALADERIAKDGNVDNGYRGQIASFGASISMGSLLAAISFFSKESENPLVDRTKLMRAILALMPKDSNGDKENSLFACVRRISAMESEASAKEKVVNASVALKLAMNLYHIVRKEE